MYVFLKDAWIEQALLKSYTVRSIAAGQETYNAQIIEITRRLPNKSYEVKISDSRHHITAIMASGVFQDFENEIALEFSEVNGCYITVDGYYYDYSHSKAEFVIHVTAFTYRGGESETYGEPVDVNMCFRVKELAKLPVFASFSVDEVVISAELVKELFSIDRDLCKKYISEETKEYKLQGNLQEKETYTDLEDHKNAHSTIESSISARESLDQGSTVVHADLSLEIGCLEEPKEKMDDTGVSKNTDNNSLDTIFTDEKDYCANEDGRRQKMKAHSPVPMCDKHSPTKYRTESLNDTLNSAKCLSEPQAPTLEDRSSIAELVEGKYSAAEAIYEYITTEVADRRDRAGESGGSLGMPLLDSNPGSIESGILNKNSSKGDTIFNLSMIDDFLSEAKDTSKSESTEGLLKGITHRGLLCDPISHTPTQPPYTAYNSSTTYTTPNRFTNSPNTSTEHRKTARIDSQCTVTEDTQCINEENKTNVGNNKLSNHKVSSIRPTGESITDKSDGLNPSCDMNDAMCIYAAIDNNPAFHTPKTITPPSNLSRVSNVCCASTEEHQDRNSTENRTSVENRAFAGNSKFTEDDKKFSENRTSTENMGSIDDEKSTENRAPIEEEKSTGNRTSAGNKRFTEEEGFRENKRSAEEEKSAEDRDRRYCLLISSPIVLPRNTCPYNQSESSSSVQESSFGDDTITLKYHPVKGIVAESVDTGCSKDAVNTGGSQVEAKVDATDKLPGYTIGGLISKRQLGAEAVEKGEISAVVIRTDATETTSDENAPADNMGVALDQSTLAGDAEAPFDEVAKAEATERPVIEKPFDGTAQEIIMLPVNQKANRTRKKVIYGKHRATNKLLEGRSDYITFTCIVKPMLRRQYKPIIIPLPDFHRLNSEIACGGMLRRLCKNGLLGTEIPVDTPVFFGENAESTVDTESNSSYASVYASAEPHDDRRFVSIKQPRSSSIASTNQLVSGNQVISSSSLTSSNSLASNSSLTSSNQLTPEEAIIDSYFTSWRTKSVIKLSRRLSRITRDYNRRAYPTARGAHRKYPSSKYKIGPSECSQTTKYSVPDLIDWFAITLVKKHQCIKSFDCLDVKQKILDWIRMSEKYEVHSKRSGVECQEGHAMNSSIECYEAYERSNIYRNETNRHRMPNDLNEAAMTYMDLQLVASSPIKHETLDSLAGKHLLNQQHTKMVQGDGASGPRTPLKSLHSLRDVTDMHEEDTNKVLRRGEYILSRRRHSADELLESSLSTLVARRYDAMPRMSSADTGRVADIRPCRPSYEDTTTLGISSSATDLDTKNSVTEQHKENDGGRSNTLKNRDIYVKRDIYMNTAMHMKRDVHMNRHLYLKRDEHLSTEIDKQSQAMDRQICPEDKYGSTGSQAMHRQTCLERESESQVGSHKKHRRSSTLHMESRGLLARLREMIGMRKYKSLYKKVKPKVAGGKMSQEKTSQESMDHQGGLQGTQRGSSGLKDILQGNTQKPRLSVAKKGIAMPAVSPYKRILERANAQSQTPSGGEEKDTRPKSMRRVVKVLCSRIVSEERQQGGKCTHRVLNKEEANGRSIANSPQATRASSPKMSCSLAIGGNWKGLKTNSLRSTSIGEPYPKDINEPCHRNAGELYFEAYNKPYPKNADKLYSSDTNGTHRITAPNCSLSQSAVNEAILCNGIASCDGAVRWYSANTAERRVCEAVAECDGSSSRSTLSSCGAESQSAWRPSRSGKSSTYIRKLRMSYGVESKNENEVVNEAMDENVMINENKVIEDDTNELVDEDIGNVVEENTSLTINDHTNKAMHENAGPTISDHTNELVMDRGVSGSLAVFEDVINSQVSECVDVSAPQADRKLPSPNAPECHSSVTRHGPVDDPQAITKGLVIDPTSDAGGLSSVLDFCTDSDS